jgi:hypothetical protein
MDEAKRKRIEKRAYYIWERAGRPEGRSLEHWKQAEILESLAVTVERYAEPHLFSSLFVTPDAANELCMTIETVPLAQRDVARRSSYQGQAVERSSVNYDNYFAWASDLSIRKKVLFEDVTYDWSKEGF